MLSEGLESDMSLDGISLACRAAAALATTLLLAACTGGGPGGPAERASRPVAESGQAPEFELQSVEGRTVRLSDSAGKVRLIDFWATWCAPCREEIPMLNELHETYADKGLVILGITDEDKDVVGEFVEEHGVRYTNLVDGLDVSDSYGVLGLPTAYLLDSAGRIVWSHPGPKPARVLHEKIRALLEAVPAT
jgi:thiol-disulfide isomerase/thioredoxin